MYVIWPEQCFPNILHQLPLFKKQEGKVALTSSSGFTSHPVIFFFFLLSLTSERPEFLKSNFPKVTCLVNNGELDVKAA